MDGVELTVRAQIKRFNLSAHADKIGLTQVINKVNPKHLILVHGSLSTLKSLACSGDLRSKHYIHIPSVGELISFGTPPVSANQNRFKESRHPKSLKLKSQPR
jgi:mRNA degradation ribonuclease J1/J2